MIFCWLTITKQKIRILLSPENRQARSNPYAKTQLRTEGGLWPRISIQGDIQSKSEIEIKVNYYLTITQAGVNVDPCFDK